MSSAAKHHSPTGVVQAVGPSQLTCLDQLRPMRLHKRPPTNHCGAHPTPSPSLPPQNAVPSTAVDHPSGVLAAQSGQPT